jgi:FKBP-type peptidyl-prolyl cis-trans isomerase
MRTDKQDHRTIARGICAAVLGALAVCCAPSYAQSGTSFDNAQQRQSYAMGMSLARQLRKDTAALDSEAFLRGLTDAFASRETLLTPPEAERAVLDMQQDLKKQQAALKAEQQLKQQDEQAFLAAHKQKDGVVALESGLQYRILKAGDGKKPARADTVVCNYRASLINGTEVENSYARNQPVSFPVRKVIRGWSEALQLMPVGSKWELVIPSSLAYGKRGAGKKIGPDTPLIFEVELLAIKEAAEAAASVTTQQN